MTAEVNFHPEGHRYGVRCEYKAVLVKIVKRLPAFARRWHPESRTQRRNGGVSCLSLCRQRAYYRRTCAGRSAK